MKSKLITPFFILSMYSTTILAQEVNKKGSVNGGAGHFAIGFEQANISSFNTALVNNGFPAFNANMVSFGGEGHAIINNLIIGGEGHGFSNRESANNTYQTSIDGGYGFFNIGYVIFTKGSFLLYPIIGFGGGNIAVKLGENPGSVAFSSVLTNPRKEISMNTGGFMMHLKLAADFIVGKKRNSEQEGGLMLGVHIGYNYVPGTWRLKWEESNITNAPTLNLNGPFLRIVMGGGGFSSK